MGKTPSPSFHIFRSLSLLLLLSSALQASSSPLPTDSYTFSPRMALFDNSAGSISRRAQELLDTESLIVDVNNPRHAAEFFEGAGVCIFPEVFSTALMDLCNAWLVQPFEELDAQLSLRGIDLHSPFRFNEVCRRRFGRYDTRGVGIDGPHFKDNVLGKRCPICLPASYGCPELIQNLMIQGEENPLLPFVRAVLGDDAVELWRGVVDNREGSSDQKWHRDGGHIFQHTHLPAHCLVLFIPLVDITLPCGPTQFYPGSHAAWRWSQYDDVNVAGKCHVPFCTPLCARGSVIAFDFRTERQDGEWRDAASGNSLKRCTPVLQVHRGTANTGDTNRPIFYIVFARPWFKDANNFPTDKPLSAPVSPSSAETQTSVPW